MTTSSTPPGNFKQSVREICQQPELNPQELDDLLHYQSTLLQPAPSWQQRLKSPMAGWLASVLLILGIMLYHLQPQDFRQEIAYEVVKNHLKLKPLDIQTNRLKELQAYFTQLDFSPSRSNILEQEMKLADKYMLGGRYCSIKGVTAAQLRYQTPDLHTFYQVPYNPKLHGDIPDVSQQQMPDTLQLNGLEVQLWRENGLLMVLVGEG